MIGSIIGDIVGSVYEFHNIKTKEFPFFGSRANFTDDSIMTIAVADWLLRDPTFSHQALEESMIWFAREYPCPMGGYGGMFARWIEHPEGRVETHVDGQGKQHSVLISERKPYGSCGNGSAMRVSAVGWMFDTLGQTLEVAAQSASITHNHPEGIKGAQATALSIFLARRGTSKQEISAEVEERFGYDLSMSVEELQHRYSWKGIDCQGDGGLCQDSVPQALICALKATDYEDAVRNAVSIGGDSDTIACITGAVAEALYGIPSDIREKGLSYLPEEFVEIVTCFESKYGAGKTVSAQPQRRPDYTPDHIEHLESNEIFVFGSNLEGRHGGGAALMAYKKFGAVRGVGVGLQGQSYAIPTMQGGVETIRPYVDQFAIFARMHPELIFYVTRIGCGIAGFSDAEIAPLFAQARELPNVILPKSFAMLLAE